MTARTNERPTPAATDAGQGSRAASNRNRRKPTADRAASPRAPLTLPAPTEWAASLIGRATGFVPEYGSPEFKALPDNSPEKVASCVRAAEAWRHYFSPEEIARRLRAELEAAWLADDKAEWSAETVEMVRRAANRPSYAVLCDRRGEPEKADRARARERHLRAVSDG